MLTRSLVASSWRDLRGRGWQLALMVVGVALGVAVVVAINLANGSARRAFELSTETVVGRATHRIVGGPSGLSPSVYTELKRAGIQAELAPIVEGYLTTGGDEGRPLRLLGVDPLAEAPFRDFFARSEVARPGFEAFYTKPGTVIVTAGLARDLGIGPGDTFQAQVGDRLVDLMVLGVLATAAEEDRPLPDDIVLADIASAQELLSQQEQLTRIDVIASTDQLAALRSVLPAAAYLEPASEQAETAAELSRAFQLNLTALSLLALVVGMFLIYNSVMFSVVQRRRVLAIFRSLGTTGDQLLATILFEATIVGAVGSLLGLGLGWILGQGAVRLVSQTINDFYFVVSVRQAPLTSTVVATGLLLGIGSSVLSAAGPGLEAARVQPVAAMRRSSLERRVRGWVPKASVGGLLLIALSTALLFVLPASIVASFAGMFGIVLGIALAVPQITIWSMRVAGVMLDRLTGPLGRLAARTVVRALSRTSVAVAALMVALSVTIGVGIMIESFRSTVENWLDLTLRADIYVAAPAVAGTRPTADLDPAWADAFEQLAGVEAVETFRSVQVDSEFGLIQLSVADAARERDARLYRFAEGSPAQVWQQVVEGAVIVSEPFANQHGLPSRGAQVTLETAKGARSFPVVGIYYDYASDRGTVLMADTIYRRYWLDRAVSSFALYLEEEAELGTVAERVQDLLRGSGLIVRANREIRQEALEIFDRTFAITAGLRLLAVVVAFIGILSALLALQLERRRELATLQALGLTQRDLYRLTLMETGLMGATAGLLSLPTGLILALVLIYVINLRSFGWTIQLSATPSIFIQALVVAVAAALLAGLYPLRRQGRMQVADALRGE